MNMKEEFKLTLAETALLITTIAACLVSAKGGDLNSMFFNAASLTSLTGVAAIGCVKNEYKDKDKDSEKPKSKKHIKNN